MDLYVELRVLLIVGLSAVVAYSEKITYKEAEIIFQNLLSSTGEFKNDEFPQFQHPSTFSDPIVRFTTFMRDHNKVYDSKDELFQRHDNFVFNIDNVEDISVADKGTARYGINKFSDLSAEELEQLTGIKDQFGSSLQYESDVDERTELEKQAIEKIPTWKKSYPKSLDWRDKGVISKVKNQGQCSCCWAFSSVGVVEAMHAIARKDLVELSVQQLVDCDKSNEGCGGGLMDIAFDYIIKNGGVESEQDYPYQATQSQGGCKVNAGNTKSKYGLEKYKRITEGGEDEMKKWVAQHGPLSVGINARGIFFYTSGIVDLGKINCNPEEQNHAVIVVGYGEEKKHGKTVPYWIVKNSWGEDWGEKGYFKLRRGANTCGISEYVHGVTVPKRNEKNKSWVRWLEYNMLPTKYIMA